MRAKILGLVFLMGGWVVLGLPPFGGFWGGDVTAGAHPYTRVVSAGALQDSYLEWRDQFETYGGDHNLVVPLGPLRRAKSTMPTAGGMARLDLFEGRVQIDLGGLDDGEWDLWLVDNLEGEGHSTLPDAGDRIVRVGSVETRDGQGSLVANLSQVAERQLQIDRVVVTRAGERPEENPLLVGAPNLFERLYTQTARAPRGDGSAAFGPVPARAVDSPFNSMDPLVARGADLFFNETFGGNGRTCATCHPAENNFTIDARFVATLSDDDPLFVPEQVPALADLDNPVLIRSLGLINVPIDGLDNPPVQRAVPHLLGLSRYLEPGNQAVPPLQRTGWGGDGAPGSGTLREFSLGAVEAHFTLSMDRIPGVDFRVPTDGELDALEAFMLVLGRQDNPDISEIAMVDPVAEAGRQFFNVFAVDAALCTFCHQEGGANGPNEGLNSNFDIGISALAFHPAEAIQPGSLAPDGGFGTEPLFDPDTNEFLGFGTFNVEEDVNERRFNSFPAIEAVDTGPFFHNHAIDTLEEAIDFYNSDEFLSAPSALPIKMSTTEVEAIGSFLRVMNTLENIRSSNLVAQAAIDESDNQVSKRLAFLASADTEDGYQVLEERFIHPAVIAKLKAAHGKEKLASKISNPWLRRNLLARAIDLKEEARIDLVIEP